MFKEWTTKRFFQGELKGNRQSVVKCSNHITGICSRLCSSDGEVKTRLYVDPLTARTMIEVTVWNNKRKRYKEVYLGVL